MYWILDLGGRHSGPYEKDETGRAMPRMLRRCFPSSLAFLTIHGDTVHTCIAVSTMERVYVKLRWNKN